MTRPPAPRAVGGPPAPPTRSYARTSGGKRRGVLALAALGAVTVVAAAIALFAGGGSERASGGGPSARTQTQQQSRSAGQQTSRTVTAPAPEINKTGESPEALNDRGFASLRTDPAAAILVLEASVRGFERQGEAADRVVYGYALYNLGQAYLRSGRATDAIAMFDRRLEVNPSDRPGVIRQAIAEAKAQLGLGKKAKKRKGA